MKDTWVIAFLTGLALLFMGALAWGVRDRVLTGHNDFIQLYSGARLVGTPGLYDRTAVRLVQEREMGVTGESWRYTRLPYYAALLWPLGRMQYTTAYWLWESLAFAALMGFAALWPATSRPITALFTSVSFPAFAGLMNGQDVTFLLLWIAAAALLLRRGHGFAAGVVFSLCAAKYHLFVLVPLLVAAQRKWRFAKGMLAGGAGLAAISFAVAGPAWPVDYFHVVTDPITHPGVGNMPNLHGLFLVLGAAPWLQWCLAPLVIGAVWMVARRMPFEYGLAAALVGGLLLSYHAYVPDCSVLLPAALVVVNSSASRALGLLAALLLTPVIYFLLLAPSSPLAAAVPLSVLAFLTLMTIEAWRHPKTQCDPESAARS